MPICYGEAFCSLLASVFSEFISCGFFLKAIDFVDSLLRYDHQERPTAKEAMVRLFFYKSKPHTCYDFMDLVGWLNGYLFFGAFNYLSDFCHSIL